jgi:hypothetical protein
VKIRGVPTPSSEGAPEEGIETEEERWVRCAACQERVAKDAARIAVNGAHEHSFMNPAGLRFTVDCFASAPGCIPDGERSTVWTWFPGYAWQIALCRRCGSHLGWSFHGSDGASFHGLVADRISS